MIRINKNKKGFTLVEAMMATVVLSIASLGILMPFTSGAMMRKEGVQRTIAAKLAGDLIEQIAAAVPFDEILTLYGEYAEAKGQVKDAAGVQFSGSYYANYSRETSCQYVYLSQQSGDGSPNCILISVSVYYNDQLVKTIQRLISE